MIQRVNATAHSNGMENIQITSKTGDVLYNSALIAGVEDLQDFDNPDYKTEDEKDDELVQSSQDKNSPTRTR